ncbi:hypothetical protein TNCV_3120691 [Trichonephila clavipes]|uniref:Uncharacterized protein n=1 Tax=Trichonephila clavipes TaxID=2585209 RepID=A0A8X6W9X5_TRICX|nr:hypothetical protein TNCV_3120691 [Trichonephila clavipes]
MSRNWIPYYKSVIMGINLDDLMREMERNFCSDSSQAMRHGLTNLPVETKSISTWRHPNLAEPKELSYS